MKARYGGTHICNPSTPEVETGDLGFQSYHQLYNEASLGYQKMSQKNFLSYF